MSEEVLSKDFAAVLSPLQLGADILVHLANQRATGRLTVRSVPGRGVGEQQLWFREGRPEMLLQNGKARAERSEVLSALQAIAVAITGTCEFISGDVQNANLRIDTLGETLQVILKGLSPLVLMTFWPPRRSATAMVTPLFTKLNQAVIRLGGKSLRAPMIPMRMDDLLSGADEDTQRAWAVQLCLGGLQLQGHRLTLQPVGSVGAASPASQVVAPTSLLAELPQIDLSQLSPEARDVAQQILNVYAKEKTLNHYQILGIENNAPSDAIRRAYLGLAKRWHSDGLAALKLPDEIKKLADALFRRADEAQRILMDAKERKGYDWLLERQAQGLPTDPAVIMEAESIFQRAEVLVRRGQAAAAEPLLRQAIDMNRGEPEFWAYYGFSIYAAHGSSQVDAARSALQKAIALMPSLDVSYEFLGRIAHQEGQLPQAQKHFEEALKLNPQNHEAARELRLITMRTSEGNNGAKKKGSGTNKEGWLARLFKR